MQRFETRSDLDSALGAARAAGRSIGLVPTMGNLHDGHLALVDVARTQCDYVLASIFVNPLQFGPDEDLDNYPRTLTEDCAQLADKKCDAVFVPPVSEMYPGGLDNLTQVKVPGLSDLHCGKSRPVHFGGVCTVVCKLFNLTMPDQAFFGEKDFQQLQIIRKMTADLCMPVKIVGVPTVRMANGLAMSSRNNYLEPGQLETASNLYGILQDTARRLQEGSRKFLALEMEARAALVNAGLQPDYFTVCNAITLQPAAESDTELVILAAAYLGQTRLIDNIQLHL